MTHREISNSDDTIDIRDVIARFEELEDARENAAGDADLNTQDEFEELVRFDLTGYGEKLRSLTCLLEECKGNGGDEQWRGDWYPGLLVRDSYFRTYAQELADDIGAINADATWPCNCIDWDQAARELRMDYTAVEFNGVTYWARCRAVAGARRVPVACVGGSIVRFYLGSTP